MTNWWDDPKLVAWYGFTSPVVAMHPHNNCSVCHGSNDSSTKLDAHQQLEILLRCFRQSAQDTLGSLDKRGYEIVKKSE